MTDDDGKDMITAFKEINKFALDSNNGLTPAHSVLLDDLLLIIENFSYRLRKLENKVNEPDGISQDQ